MVKQTRFFQKIFASNAPAAEVGKFGSFAAGDPASAANPDEIQSLSQFVDGWNSAVSEDNAPCIEDFNALAQLFSYQLSYLLTAGVAEWHSGTTYYVGHIVSDGSGFLYRSLSNDNLNNAITDGTKWTGISGGLSLWSSTENYTAGDIVINDQGEPYRARINSVGAALSTSSWTSTTIKIPRWDANITYTTGDVIASDGGVLYRSLIDSNVNNALTSVTSWEVNTPTSSGGSGSLLAWSASTTYSIGDLVVDSYGAIYRSRADSNTNNTLLGTYWTPGNYITPRWNSVISYAVGDTVVDTTGRSYRSLQASNLNQDLTSETWWKSLNETIPIKKNTITYAINDLVASSDGDIYRSIAAGNLNQEVSSDTYWKKITSTGGGGGDADPYADYPPNCVVSGRNYSGVPGYLFVSSGSYWVVGETGTPFIYRINGVTRSSISNISKKYSTSVSPFSTANLSFVEDQRYYQFEEDGHLLMQKDPSVDSYTLPSTLYGAQLCFFRGSNDGDHASLVGTCTMEDLNETGTSASQGPYKVFDVRFNNLRDGNSTLTGSGSLQGDVPDLDDQTNIRITCVTFRPVFVVQFSEGPGLVIGKRILTGQNYNDNYGNTGDYQYHVAENQWYVNDNTDDWIPTPAAYIGGIFGSSSQGKTYWGFNCADFGLPYSSRNDINMDTMSGTASTNFRASDPRVGVREISIGGKTLLFNGPIYGPGIYSNGSTEYLYMDLSGVITNSIERPSYYKNRKGWYHPTYMRRCIGIAYRSTLDAACGSYGYNSLPIDFYGKIWRTSTSTLGGGDLVVDAVTRLPFNNISTNQGCVWASNKLYILPYPIKYHFTVKIPTNDVHDWIVYTVVFTPSNFSVDNHADETAQGGSQTSSISSTYILNTTFRCYSYTEFYVVYESTTTGTTGKTLGYYESTVEENVPGSREYGSIVFTTS